MKSLEAGLAWWHPWITPLSATLNINTRHIRFEIEPFDASKYAVFVFESLWWQVVKYFPWSSNLRGFEFCKISLHLKYVEPFEQGGRSFKCIETKDSRLKQIFRKHFRDFLALPFFWFISFFSPVLMIVVKRWIFWLFVLSALQSTWDKSPTKGFPPNVNNPKKCQCPPFQNLKIFALLSPSILRKEINRYVFDWQSVLMAFIGLQELLQEGLSDSLW